MAEKIELDVDLQALQRDFEALSAEAKQFQSEATAAFNKVGAAAQKAGDTTNDAFNIGLAQGLADGINDLQKEYKDLEASAKTLKSALKNATDPAAVKLYADNVAKLEAGMKQLEGTAKKAGVSLKEVNKNAGVGKEVFGELFGQFGKAALIATAITAVVKFTASSVSLAAETEKATKQIEAFLGSADKAKGLTADLIALGKQKFIPTDDIIKAGKSMLGFGFAADEVTSRLARISEISKGTGKDFNELATIYGKAKTAGTLYAEDINQLLEAGVNIIPEFAKQLGVSNDQVKKLGSEGKITFAELELAFFNLTKQGATFAGQSEAAAQTLSGQWDIFKQNVESASRSFGEFLTPALTSFLEFANKGLSSLGGLVSGLFKTDQEKGIVQVGVEIVYDPVSGAAMEVPIYEAAKKSTEEGIKDGAKVGAEAEQKILEDAAKKARERAGKKAKQDAANKAAKDAAAAEKERQRLVLDAMREGEAKEIAQENYRIAELKKALKKYRIDSSEAEAQHQINLGEIRLKYYLERLTAQNEAIQAEKESIERGYAELEKLDLEKEERDKLRKSKTLALRELDAQIAGENFEAAVLAERRVFFQTKRNDDEVDKYEKEVQKRREIFDLTAQAEALRRQLEFGENISEQETLLLEKRIENIVEKRDQLVAGLGEGQDGADGKGSFLGKLLGLDDKDADKVKAAAEQIVNSLRSVIQARIDAAQTDLDIANEKVKTAEEQIKKEQELKDQGYANDLEARQRDLADARAAQRTALEEKKRAQRQELVIDTATQLSNTATAVTNIIKDYSKIPFVGVLLGIAAVGSLFAFLQSARARSKAINTQQFRKGGDGKVGNDGVIIGPSHERGGIVVPEYEGGEFFTSDGKQFAVVNKKMTSKHFGLLQAVNRDDRGAMRKYIEQLSTRPRFTHAVSDSHSAPHSAFDNNSDITTLLEENNRLQRENLRLNKERPTIIDKGDRVEIMYPNGKTIRLRK